MDEFNLGFESKMKKFRKDINQKLDKAISTFMHVKTVKQGSKMLVPINKYFEDEFEKIRKEMDDLHIEIKVLINFDNRRNPKISTNWRW